ncbi:hypothetical protein [uncultured Gammaproteobacteria bacterium]|nr:hypothetical protein [uncultured Gammaproteobacteria bacterium]
MAKSNFCQLVISLNLVLAELRLGLKNCQVGEKWVSDDCSYLCKGLKSTKKSKTVYMVNNTHNKQHSFVVLLSEPLDYSNFIMV